MKYLVTGGSGFIGSNYLHYVVDKYPDDYFVCLDALTYSANYNNIKDLESKSNYKFIKMDIRDRDSINKLFIDEMFDVVINFAAECNVDISINNPNIFVETNVMGTVNLLNAFKMIRDDYGKKVTRFHQISTDEVYGDLPLDRIDLKFDENSPIHTSSPYSSSKASADLFVMAYYRTYNLPVSISRCSNNYGPYQAVQALIPVMIRKCVNNEKLPVYGDGKNVRDWIYVYDHCVGIDLIIRKGKIGEIYNLGGNSERDNLTVVKTIIKYLNKSEELITFVKDRPGHDLRYAMDSSKIESELGWKRTHSFEDGIKETIDWYLSHEEWLKDSLL